MSRERDLMRERPACAAVCAMEAGIGITRRDRPGDPDAQDGCALGTFPSVPEPRRSAKKALLAVIPDACVRGVSTRSADDRVKAMKVPCVEGINKHA